MSSAASRRGRIYCALTRSQRHSLARELEPEAVEGPVDSRPRLGLGMVSCFEESSRSVQSGLRGLGGAALDCSTSDSG
jgi:hypothetical protein